MRAHVAGACMASLLALSGCGAGQSVTSGTSEAARWAFTTKVKMMKVDLVSRAAVNPDASGVPLSTVVRLYQLKRPTTFEKLTYAELQSDDLRLLKGELLDTTSVVLRPGTSEDVSEPMHPDAGFVGVVAFFRDVDQTAVWKVVLPKAQWKKTRSVMLEVHGSHLQVVNG